MPEAVIRGSTLTNGFRGSHPTALAGISSIQSHKAALRSRLRNLRRHLAVDEHARLNQRISDHLLSSSLLLPGSSLGLYLPTDYEVDTTPILHHAWQLGCHAHLPVVDDSSQTMAFYPVRPEDLLRPSRWGILEPPVEGRRACPLAQLELLLIPLVGFDPVGHRLGFGGGYFDRALAPLTAQPRPRRIGLAYGFQEVAELPDEPHDVRLHGVVTEAGLRLFATLLPEPVGSERVDHERLG